MILFKEMRVWWFSMSTLWGWLGLRTVFRSVNNRFKCDMSDEGSEAVFWWPLQDWTSFVEFLRISFKAAWRLYSLWVTVPIFFPTFSVLADGIFVSSIVTFGTISTLVAVCLVHISSRGWQISNCFLVFVSVCFKQSTRTSRVIEFLS